MRRRPRLYDPTFVVFGHTVDPEDYKRARSFLLRRMSERERHAFERRLLDEPGLLSVVKATEADFLAGNFVTKMRLRRTCAICFAAGAALAAAVTALALRFFA